MKKLFTCSFFKKINFAIVLLVFFYSVSTFGLTTNWTGLGLDGNWSNAANWDNGVPGINDEAAFSVSGTTTISSATGTPQISRLFVSGGSNRSVILNINLDINGGSSSSPAVQVNAGQLTFGSGFTFNIQAASGQDGIYVNNANGILTIDGVVNATSNNKEAVDVNLGQIINNGTLNIIGTPDVRTLLINKGTLNNNGTITLSGGKQFSRAQINDDGADPGTLNNNKGATLDTGDGRIKVNLQGEFTNNGLFLSSIASPLRSDATSTAIINNGFFQYSTATDFCSDGTNPKGTDNGIDLNNSAETSIDLGGGCTVDIAQVDYEWFQGASSVGTADGTGSLTLNNMSLSSDPATVQTSEYGSAVQIVLSNICAAALPIELTSLEAKTTDKGVQIKWTTASEENNDYMAVERSADGRRFAEIGRVKGAGTTLEPQEYNFTDPAPRIGVNYYRLRQVDMDGTMDYTHIVQATVGANTKIGNLKVTPTVGRGGVEQFVDLSAFPEGEVTLQVWDQVGRLVMQQDAVAGAKVQLNTTQLQSGLYFVRIAGLQDNLIGEFMKSN